MLNLISLKYCLISIEIFHVLKFGQTQFKVNDQIISSFNSNIENHSSIRKYPSIKCIDLQIKNNFNFISFYSIFQSNRLL